MEENELIEGCINGDIHAQKALYRQYGRALMGICMRYTKCREDAEEIFHDSMMKVYTSISGFKHQSKLYAWMSRIVVNTCLDFLKKQKRLIYTQTLTVHPVDIEDEIDAESCELIDPQLAFKILQGLNINQQTIINLYVIDGLRHAEIAEKLQISELAARAQYSRARRALRNEVNKYIKKNEII